MRIAVLGSTGSIGLSTLDIIRRNRAVFSLIAVGARNNHDLLIQQAKEFNLSIVASTDPDAYQSLKAASVPSEIICEDSALEQISIMPEVDVVVAAVSGFAGFKSVISAIKAGKRIALANKETLVAGGDYVMQLAQKSGALVVPLDSEHSSLFQCLQASFAHGEVEDLIITASGGPFWGYTSEQMLHITPEQAVKHPRWSMGKKISVDSATMMNKGLEVIETARLFNPMQAGLSKKIRVLVHPQSVVHGLVNFADGVLMAVMFGADMRVPIAYALSYLYKNMNKEHYSKSLEPAICSGVSRLDLSQIGNLEFSLPDDTRFPALNLCRQALNEGGICPAVLSAANEVAVEAFLSGRLSFAKIVNIVASVLDKVDNEELLTYEQVIEADLWGRKEANSLLARC